MEIIKEILSTEYLNDDNEHLSQYARVCANFFELVKHQMYCSHTRSVTEIVPIVLKNEDNFIRQKLCLDMRFQFDIHAYDFLQKYAVAVMQEYQRLLADRKLYDFQDLVLQMGLLLEYPYVCVPLSERYRYVHIDETQDISDIEYDILTRMFPKAIFLLCGDINQTIYEWRGSVPEKILPQYIQNFNAVQVILDKNYRSTKGLINLGERFVCRSLTRYDAPPLLYSDSEVQVKQFANEAQQVHWMYQTAKGLDMQGDYSKIAILCRSNSQCDKIAHSFADFQRNDSGNTIRFMLAEEFKLFRAKEVKDILAFIRLMLNKSEDTALARVAEYYFMCDRKTLKDIREQKHNLGIRLSDYISPITQICGDYFSLLHNALSNGNVVVFDTETTGVDIYNDQIIQVAAIRINSQSDVLDKYVEFVKPSKSVGKSEYVHHFSDKFLSQNGKTPIEVLSKLADFLHGKVVVGHNVGYDMGILNTELQSNGLPDIEIQGVYDTLDIARRYLTDTPNHKLETVSILLDTICIMCDSIISGLQMIANTKLYK